MMAGEHMNGLAQHAAAVPHMPGPEGPPVVSIQNISFSGNQLRWMVMSAFGLVSALVGGGYLFMPAKQDDLKALTEVVKLVEAEGRQNREAVRHLTDAVRAVNETVVDMRIALETLPHAAPVVTVPAVKPAAAPRPRRPRPPLPAPALTQPAEAGTVPAR